jgi:class 3 adenylate cyclase/tetratricopeptide (TPR) repeat protein
MATAGRRERKVVSILFADLVGFTTRAETLDPEDVEALLRPYLEHLRGELERHGGTVEKFIGDAVMAVFGAPVAHEDDPERAVRAALAIRDWIRDEGELEARIAVNTGEALVSLGGAPAESMVAGDVVNTASRLQTAAPVNGILVGDATYRATSAAIDYHEWPAVDAKGKAAPVPAWEAVEARSRYGSDVTRGPRTPLVGRVHELGLLVNTLARVRHERAPQLVTLAGIPGIGKTRLVHELFDSIESEPDLIYWRQGRCLPYGDGVAFWALGEILKAHAGILEGEPRETADAKLLRVVEEAVPEARETEWVVRHLRPLVGLGEAAGIGADRRTESFAAWRRFFEGLAELDPLVLVFEDLHWADDGLLDFVDHLVDWASSVPILVVATARPELLARRPAWGGGKPNATTISLSPLTEQETATLVHGLMKQSVLPADVQATLLDRAGGNPLYAEEFARIALERGSLGDGELPLPASVQGLIAARLDTLSEEEKTLVQDASVVGKVFWLGAVARLGGVVDPQTLEDRLHALGRKQFVQRERRSSMEGESQYAFAHSVVRDVAYNQIPRAERTEKHRRAAAWLESLGRPAEHAELLAHHYVSALETLPAGAAEAELRRSASLALRAAGDRAASLNAFEQAAHAYDRALELRPEDDPDRPRLLLAAAMGRVRADIWDENELAVARDALLAADDRAGAAEAEITRAEVLWNLGRGDDVVAAAERAAELTADLPDSPDKASTYSGLFRLHWLANRYELATGFGNEALSMAEEFGLVETRGVLLNTFGTWRTMNGEPGGLDTIEESIALLEETNSAAAQRPYNNLADAYYNLGQFDKAVETVERMRRGWKRFGGLDYLRWMESQQIRLDYIAGRWDDVLQMADRWIADAEESGNYLEASWRWLRSRILSARGDRERALEEGVRSAAAARAVADPQIVLPALAFHGRLIWTLGDPGADQIARELVEVSRQASLGLANDWFIDAAIVLRGVGLARELAVVAESVPTATPWREAALAFGRGDVRAAAEILGEMGATPFEAEVRLLAAREGVDADLPAAIDFFREVGAASYLDEAESLLAKSRSA